MNPEDIMKAMQAQMHGHNQSTLLREPTLQELDTFIDRCLDELDEVPYTLAQSIMFKLDRSVHSPAEAEILPMVLDRMQQRGMIRFNQQ